jgi:hypothetical protein
LDWAAARREALPQIGLRRWSNRRPTIFGTTLGEKQVTLIWLGLGISVLGLVLLSVFGLTGSGDSAVGVWGYRFGLLLMFAGLALSVAVA